MDVDTGITSPCDEAVNMFCGHWTHPARLTPEAHYHKFEEFRTSANQAFQGAFPPHRQPRNTAASVLMLYWEDDDLGVASEVAMMQEVFDQSYRFETERWQIPNEKPTWKLSNKIHQWKDHYCEDGTCPGKPLPLLILYYGGHAEHSVRNICKWRRYIS